MSAWGGGLVSGLCLSRLPHAEGQPSCVWGLPRARLQQPVAAGTGDVAEGPLASVHVLAGAEITSRRRTQSVLRRQVWLLVFPAWGLVLCREKETGQRRRPHTPEIIQRGGGQAPSPRFDVRDRGCPSGSWAASFHWQLYRGVSPSGNSPGLFWVAF